MEREKNISKKENSLTGKKALGIFFLIAFVLNFLMGLGIYFGKKRGIDVNSFASFQMMTPALGSFLAILSTKKNDPLVPRKAIISYIIISVLMGLLAWIPFVNPEFNAYSSQSIVLTLGSILFIIILRIESKEAKKAFGLTFKNFKKVLLMGLLFLAIYLLRIFLLSFIEGESLDLNPGELAGKLALALVLIVNIFLAFLPFFGEEYGWRYFLQPKLQKKFGMLGGLVILGLIWGLWHLPLNLFYYSMEGTELLSLINQIILCICYSIFFAFAYSYADSIWAPVLIHYINNNFALLFVPLEELQNLDLLQNNEYTPRMVLLLAITNLILFASFALAKRNRKKEFRMADSEERYRAVKEEIRRREIAEIDENNFKED